MPLVAQTIKYHLSISRVYLVQYLKNFLWRHCCIFLFFTRIFILALQPPNQLHVGQMSRYTADKKQCNRKRRMWQVILVGKTYKILGPIKIVSV